MVIEKGSNGNRVTGERDIRTLLSNFNSNLFPLESMQDWGNILNYVPNQIIDEMNQNLTSMVTDEEVKLVVFQMGGLSCSRSGFPSLFYHRLWDMISRRVITAVKSFFTIGKLPETINYTNITLIPKVANPTCPSEFWQIHK